MAIKGKGKTKSRPPARAPRPVPVVVKPALFLRRWVQVTGAFLAGIGVMVMVVWATNQLRADDTAAADKQKADNATGVVQQWSTTVDGVLARLDPDPKQTTGDQLVLFASLSASVADLAKGKSAGAADAAGTAQTAASGAIDDLTKVDLPALITQSEGLDVTETNYVLNSKAKLLEGIQLYLRVADMVDAAVKAGPAAVDPVIANAAKLLPIAQQLVSEGYSDLSQAKASVGIIPNPQNAGGAPGGLPGGIPGLTGSPTG